MYIYTYTITYVCIYWPLDSVGQTVGQSTVGNSDCIWQSDSREKRASRANGHLV